MTFYGFGQKGSIFMAIKFEFSLVITFMAFYDCIRTLLRAEIVVQRVQPTRGWTVAAQCSTNCTHTSCSQQWGPVSVTETDSPNKQGDVGRQQQK